jgi:hypothetical protein
MKNVSVIWTEKDKIVKEVAFFGKQDIDYSVCLKNVVNFAVVLLGGDSHMRAQDCCGLELIPVPLKF